MSLLVERYASLRSGHALPPRWFHPLWEGGWKQEEWEEALGYCVEQGWLEQASGERHLLTEVGYERYF